MVPVPGVPGSGATGVCSCDASFDMATCCSYQHDGGFLIIVKCDVPFFKTDRGHRLAFLKFDMRQSFCWLSMGDIFC